MSLNKTASRILFLMQKEVTWVKYLLTLFFSYDISSSSGYLLASCLYPNDIVEKEREQEVLEAVRMWLVVS
jgi:hypothetical protein